MPDAPPPRRLTRSHDRKLGGVLGGVADYLGADPTLIRVLYVVLLLLGFLPFGVVLYFVMWIVMPEPSGQPVARPAAGGAASETDTGLILGVVLLVIGALVLLGRGWFSPWGWFGWNVGLAFHLLWPLLLVGLGIWIIMRRRA
jgi:phage shock protein C